MAVMRFSGFSDDLARQLKVTLGFSLPLIASNLAQSSKHLTDAVMLGRYGVDELAAGVLGGTVFMIIFIVGSGFGMAAVPLASAARGAGLTWRVRRVVRMSLWLTFLFWLAMITPMLFVEELLLLFGQQDLVADLAGEYMLVALWGILPAMTVMVLKSFFMALGRPRVIFWATLIGAVLNIPANYAFIFGNWGAPELGIKGAAIATIAAHGVSLLIMLLHLATRSAYRRYELFRRFWTPDWPCFREVFRLGWPISLTLTAETGFFAICSIMMGWISTENLAAHGIALESAAFVFMIYLGISNAATAQVGFATGSCDRAALTLAAKAAVLLTLAAATSVVIVFLCFPEILVLAFLDRDSSQAAAVLAIGITLIQLAAAFQIGDAMQVVALGLLRGMSDTRMPMIIATISYTIIGVPTSYVLGFVLGFGGTGVWIGFIVGLGIAAILLFLRFRILLAEFSPHA
ncbi:MAG: MATE family efflux transporter [Rhodobacteraceae bacterium]|nr:MATE family efflux transporter [Paracoccaceae bacterium]